MLYVTTLLATGGFEAAAFALYNAPAHWNTIRRADHAMRSLNNQNGYIHRRRGEEQNERPRSIGIYQANENMRDRIQRSRKSPDKCQQGFTARRRGPIFFCVCVTENTVEIYMHANVMKGTRSVTLDRSKSSRTRELPPKCRRRGGAMTSFSITLSFFFFFSYLFQSFCLFVLQAGESRRP